MAKKYKILETNPKTNTHEFLVDDVADLVKLPKETGSLAFMANTGDLYVCNNLKEWKNVSDPDAPEIINPSGTLTITENGTGIDVTEYAAVDVNVANSGSEANITDVWLWNMSDDVSFAQVIPSEVAYISAVGEAPVFTNLEFEQITDTFQGDTIYGVHIKEAPVGATLFLTLQEDGGVEFSGVSIGYSHGYDIESISQYHLDIFTTSRISSRFAELFVPIFFDGEYFIGIFSVASSSLEE